MQGLEGPLSGCVWIRTAANANANSAYEPIPNSDNQMEYHLTADDVDCFISFRHSYMVPGATEPTVIQAEHSVGPVLAGPARLLDLRILGFSQSYTTTAEGEAAFNGVFRVGRAVIANTKYIGGKQGCSEFWWLKTNSDGNREELSKRAAIDAQHIDKDLTYLLDIENVLENEEVVNSGVLDDPRVYVIKSQDCGATLKVKCVPVRGDNYNGEVCTSKPSAVIEGELKEQSNNDNTYISELSISETNI